MWEDVFYDSCLLYGRLWNVCDILSGIADKLKEAVEDEFGVARSR